MVVKRDKKTNVISKMEVDELNRRKEENMNDILITSGEIVDLGSELMTLETKLDESDEFVNCQKPEEMDQVGNSSENEIEKDEPKNSNISKNPLTWTILIGTRWTDGSDGSTFGRCYGNNKSQETITKIPITQGEINQIRKIYKMGFPCPHCEKEINDDHFSKEQKVFKLIDEKIKEVIEQHLELQKSYLRNELIEDIKKARVYESFPKLGN